MQAQAALHGEYLQDRARAWQCTALAEAARAVQSVAHAWTGVRVTAAHGVDAPRAAHPDLSRHARRLRQAYEAAMDAIGAAAGELAGTAR
jgi:hypothetical protein